MILALFMILNFNVYVDPLKMKKQFSSMYLWIPCLSLKWTKLQPLILIVIAVTEVTSHFCVSSDRPPPEKGLLPRTGVGAGVISVARIVCMETGGPINTPIRSLPHHRTRTRTRTREAINTPVR